MLLSMYKKNKFPSDIIHKILQDNLAFSTIVSKVIEADWKYQEDRASIKTCRYNYCMYGIHNYIKELYKIKNKNILSLDYIIDATTGDTAYASVPDESDPPSKIAEDNDKFKYVRKYLNKLDDYYKVPMYQYFFEDKSCREIGESLGYSRQNIDRIIKEGLKRLKHVLANLA